MATVDSASPKSTLLKVADTIALVITITLALYHMYTASFGIMPAYAQSAIHWGLVGSYIIIRHPLKFKGGFLIDYALIAINIFLSYYQLVIQDKFVLNAGVYSKFELYLSIISIVVAIEISRRAIGMVLPVISILFVMYALLGSNLPGIFRTVKFSIERIAPYLYTSSDGLYGQTLYVSAQFIFLFVLFGAILDMTGAGEFFVNIAFSLTGKVRGGPAQAAVYSSMLMGTINGSGAANVVTTGTFTIPLMKKVGFKPAIAGAIEAVASNGGQIMPPVMGAVAFLMAEMTGIEYGKIALAALPTAILYYVTLSMSVYVEANKQNIPVTPKEDRLKAGKVMKDGWLYLVPLIVLITMLIVGYSAQKSAFFAILISIVVGFIKSRENMTLKRFLKALKEAADGIGPIAAACMLAGIVMGVINMTGLGLKISGIIMELADGRLIVALILAMLTSLLLGMGLPTSAAYMILAILVAPAIVNMGVSQLGAHLFILYFGALSTITPPVALSTFAAAGIAGSGLWETGLAAMKLAAAGFIIPFIFCYSPELLLIGAVGDIVFALITALIGCMILSIALGGWFKVNLSIISRIILLPCSILLIMPKPIIANVIGLITTIVVLYFEIKVVKRKSRSILQQNS